MLSLTNLWRSTVVTAPSPAVSGTQVAVGAGMGALLSVPTMLACWPAGVTPTRANMELVKATARSGDTLTIARLQEGSTSRAIAVGDQLAQVVTAGTFAELVAGLSAQATVGTELDSRIASLEAQLATAVGRITVLESSPGTLTAVYTAAALKIGAGGMVLHVGVANDGTKVAATDVGGAWHKHASASTWVSNTTAEAMGVGGYKRGQGGCGAIAVAPSNSAIMYKLQCDAIWGSTNGGATWTQQQGGIYDFPNWDRPKMYAGARLAVDPRDPNHALLGTVRNGLWRTTNGSTWTQVTLPADPVYPQWTTGNGQGSDSQVLWTDAGVNYSAIGVAAIAFDASSAATGTRTSKIAVGVQGRGVTLSSDGGATWALASGAPYVLTPEQLCYGPAGDLYVVTPRQAYGVAVTATGGTYTLTLTIAGSGSATTSALAHNAGYSETEAALNALPAPFNTCHAAAARGYALALQAATSGTGALTVAVNSSLSGGTATPSEITHTQCLGLKAVWRRTSAGVWSNASPGEWHNGTLKIAADPINAGRLVAFQSTGFSNNGYMGRVSTDHGATWGYSTRTVATVAGEPTWMSALWQSDPSMWMSTLGVTFGPGDPLVAYLAEGTGVWKLTFSNLTDAPAITFAPDSAGIEELVGSDVRTVTGGVVVASWDRKLWRTTDLAAYPSTYLPNTAFGSAWSIGQDPANPQSLVASLANHQDGTATAESGYSTDGGATWTAFPTRPLNTTDAFNTFGFGTIAISGNNVIWVSSYGKGAYRSGNRGTSWAAITLPGDVSSVMANDRAHYINRRPVTVDASGHFYLLVTESGVYRSTDGGVTWTLQKPWAAMPSGDFYWHSKIMATPGKTGDLWLFPGPVDDAGGGEVITQPSYRSVDSGVTWTTVDGLTTVRAAGFGLPMSGQTAPAMLVDGYLHGARGMHFSRDGGANWAKVSDYPKYLCFTWAVDGDKAVPGRFFVATDGTGFVQIDVT